MSSARRFRVTGRVQGVGYRAFTIRLARRTGVRGAVRNQADGSVLVSAQGSEEALERFREGLAQGPLVARVREVEEVPDTGDPGAERFDATF